MSYLSRIKSFFSLKEAGVLGINSRNLDYISRHNKRKFYSLVDDKVLTKSLAQQAGIPVPQLYTVIEYQEQLKRLDSLLTSHKEFVIKPAQGSGGGGIIVIKGKTSSGYIRASGKAISMPELRYHISNILSGLYALGGLRDKAIIESRVTNIPLFEQISYQGVPDIRLVVYQGVPAMAMLRLPTHASDGRANLHAGGIGVGLCLRTGRTIHAVLSNEPITRHSDTDIDLIGIQIPQWEDILHMGVKAGEMCKLGYIGVDMVMDKTHGPMLLEVNARPGIAIQIANQDSLKRRLEQIDRDIGTLITHEQKIAYARESFGVQK